MKATTGFKIVQPTNNLRWVKKMVNLDKFTAKEVKVLQQQFRNIDTEELYWQDIPVTVES